MLPDSVHRLLLKLCQQCGIEYCYRTVKSKYLRDSSCLRMRPQAVLCITHAQQLTSIIKFATQHQLTITVKGGGSNTGGAGITNGIVVDISQLNTISPPLPINQLQQQLQMPSHATHVVTVGAGTTIYELNRYLAQYSLLFPIVPTSQRLAQIGGTIATNAGSPESLRYGTMQPWIAAVDFCDGNAKTHSYIDCALSSRVSKTTDPTLFETVDAIKAIIGSRASIALRSKILRYVRYKQVPGYNLPALFRSINLHNITVCNTLIAGSMGTLGIVSRALLYCMPQPQSSHIMILAFDTLLIALTMLPKLRAIVDRFQQIVSCELLPTSRLSEPAQLLLEIRYFSHQHNIYTIRDAVRKSMRHTVDIGCFTNRSHIGDRFVQRRKTAVISKDEHTATSPIINDITIPVRRLHRVLPSLMSFLSEQQVRFTVYGHILQGNMHFRPYINFSTISERCAALQLARRFYTLVMELGGIVGGEHGTGIFRAPYLPQLWGRVGYTMMQRILNYFNPQQTLDATAMFNSVFPERLPASLYGVPYLG